MSNNINIYVATMTGTAMMVADDIVDYCEKNNIVAKVTELDYVSPESLMSVTNPILIISSTYGHGDVPDGSKEFYDSLKESKLDLKHLKYAVFGLGDMTYRDTFAFGGKKFDELFSSLKAIRIDEPYFHDASDGSLPEEKAVEWFEEKIYKLL